MLHAAHRPFEIESLELEEPHAGEVLVQLKATGVCHSDWHLATGATSHPLPVVPGHEGAGIVEAVGQGVTTVGVGDHVSLNWAPSCGCCFYCLNGRPSLCETFVGPIWAGTMADGTTRLRDSSGRPVYHFSGLAAFAEKSVVSERSCVRMNPMIPFEVAALIGCAVTTGVGSALNTAKVTSGSSVVVFGAGGVGLSTIMGARLSGCHPIIAIDRSEDKLRVAQEFGASHSFGAGDGLVETVRGLTEGRGADTVFEAIGSPEVQELCLELVRPGGTLVLSGLAPMGSSTNFPSSAIARQEKAILGCYYGSANAARDFPLYGRMFLDGLLPLDQLVTKTYRLDEINEAYAEMLAGRLARGVVVF